MIIARTTATIHPLHRATHWSLHLLVWALAAWVWLHAGFAQAADTDAMDMAPPVVQNEVTRAELMSDVARLTVSGQKQVFWAALQLDLKDEWHSYWKNPGDSGMAPSLSWQLPEGFSAGAIHYPTPERVETSGLVSFGYHGRFVLLVPITVAPDAPTQKSYALKLKAEWLVCKDICIPESAELSIQLPAGAFETSSQSGALYAVRDALPQLSKEGEASFRVVGRRKDRGIGIKVSASAWKGLFGSGVDPIVRADFYPETTGTLSHKSAEDIQIEADFVNFLFRASPDFKAGKKADVPLWGVLQLTNAAGVTRSVQVQAKPKSLGTAKKTTDANQNTTASSNAGEGKTLPIGLITALLFALLGGVILNAMPCVLPILSLKVMSLVQKRDLGQKTVVRLGVAYTLGILTCFTAIVGLLLLLQQGGEAIGWGFQLQSPVFVGFLVLLMVAIGLNLSGFFELPSLFGNVGVRLTANDNASGSFFTGLLAVLVATPCTVPFMAPAIGYALTQPTLKALLVFWMLGLGMALPYLLVSLIPSIARLFPKPGAWMITFRQVLAFPIYATAIWLLWLLTVQAGASALALTLALTLVLVMVLWVLHRRFFSPRKVFWALLYLGLCFWLSMSIGALKHSSGEAQNALDHYAEAFSQSALDEARQQNKPVFVYATASWCLTCKLNEASTLSQEEIVQHFQANEVVVLKADLTRENPEASEYLSALGRQGIPVYVFYDRGGEERFLPQLLTPSRLMKQTTPAK